MTTFCCFLLCTDSWDDNELKMQITQSFLLKIIPLYHVGEFSVWYVMVMCIMDGFHWFDFDGFMSWPVAFKEFPPWSSFIVIVMFIIRIFYKFIDMLKTHRWIGMGQAIQITKVPQIISILGLYFLSHYNYRSK